MPPDLLEARIHLRVCELRLLAAWTVVLHWQAHPDPGLAAQLTRPEATAIRPFQSWSRVRVGNGRDATHRRARAPIEVEGHDGSLDKNKLTGGHASGAPRGSNSFVQVCLMGRGVVSKTGRPRRYRPPASCSQTYF